MPSSDFADAVVAHVRAVTIANRRGHNGWIVHVVDIEAALGVPRSSLQTALRKAEERRLLRLFGDPVHSVELGEQR